MVITLQESIKKSRTGLNANYYQLPDLNDGTTIAFAKFTTQHGERTIKNRSRVYYIVHGSARFTVNNEEFEVSTGDLVVIPPFGKYNFCPLETEVQVLLISELLEL